MNDWRLLEKSSFLLGESCLDSPPSPLRNCLLLLKGMRGADLIIQADSYHLLIKFHLFNYVVILLLPLSG